MNIKNLLIKKAALCTITGLIMSSIACAESPAPAISGFNDPIQTVSSLNNSQTADLNALFFEGTDTFGVRACNVYISLLEATEVAGDHQDEHNHNLVVKYDYLIHGETPKDAFAELFYIDNGQFFEEPPTNSNSGVVLASILLMEENHEEDQHSNHEETIDYNKVNDYEQSKELAQFIKISFPYMDIKKFEETLELVAEGQATESDLIDVKDVLVASLKTFHSAHNGYDSVACVNLQFKGVQKTPFNVETSVSTDDHDNHDNHNHK